MNAPALPVPGTSGCSTLALARYAAVIADASASGGTPSLA
jgi:hypothetical protein